MVFVGFPFRSFFLSRLFSSHLCGIIHLCVAITYNSFVSFVIFGFITLYDRFFSFFFFLLLWLIHYSHGFHFAKMLVNTDNALLLL